MSVLYALGLSFVLSILEYILAPVSNVIITKSLSVSDYGIYNMLVAISNLIFSFFSLGLSQYNCRIIPGRGSDEQHQLLGMSVAVELLSSLIGVVIVTRIYSFSLASKVVLTLFILKTLVSVVNNETIRFLGYKKRNISKSIISFVDARGWLLFLVVFFVFDRVDVTTIFFVQTINSLVILVVLSFKIDLRVFIRNFRISRQFIFTVVRPSLAFVFIDVGMYFLEMGSRYILSVKKGFEDVGLFSFVYAWISVIFKFGMLLVYILQPYLSEAYYRIIHDGGMQQDWYSFRRLKRISFKYTIYVIFFAVFYLVLYYGDLVLIIGKAEYVQTYSAVVLMAPLPFLLFLTYFFQILLLLIGNSRFLPRCYIIMASINLGLNFIFIPKYGFKASALIYCICYLILSILFYLACPKDVRLELLKIGDLVEFLTVFALTVLICWLVKTNVKTSPFSMLVSLAVIAGMVVLIALKNKDDIIFLKENK